MDTQANRTRACREPKPCIYYSTYDGLCSYLLITGHARLPICGPGDACTVKATAHQSQRLSMTPDEEKAARKLYDQGHSDPVIAERLNTSRAIIRGWRLRNGLEPKAKAGRRRT